MPTPWPSGSPKRASRSPSASPPSRRRSAPARSRARSARSSPRRSRSSAKRGRLQIEAVEGSADDNGAAVADGRLHVAVCFQDAAVERREPSGTARHELGEEPMLAMVAASHPLAGEERIALRALADEIWTAPSREHLVHRACVDAGFEPRIAYVCRDPLAIGALVARGLAVTLAPRLLAGRLPGVALVPLSDEVPRRRLYALTPAAGTRPAARAFVAALAAAVPAA